MRMLHLVPEPMLVDLVDDNQTCVATEPSMPMPHAASILESESFQEAVWSSASPKFVQNYMNSPEASHFHQQENQNHFYLGSNDDDDVDMKSVREATMEPPDYSVPMMWTSIQPQPEQPIFYSQVGQVADNINQHQTYTTHDSRVSWASIVSIPRFVALLVNRIETVRRFQPMQTEPKLNHPVDSLTAEFCFWENLSKTADTSQSPATVREIVNSTSSQNDEQRPDEASKSPTTVPEIIESTPNQCDEQPPKEPSKTEKPHVPICQDEIHHQEGGSDESRIVWPKPGHRRWEKPPVGLGMGFVARLVRPLFYIICFLQLPTDFSQKRVELEGYPPAVERRKPQREDFRPEFARTCNSDFEIQAQLLPRQQRHCEPDRSKLRALPIQKRSLKFQQQQPASESSQTPTEWSFARLLPSITSLVDRFNKFF